MAKIDWKPQHDEAQNLLGMIGMLENLEFRIFKVHIPEGTPGNIWAKWVLAGPLWDDTEFLCTNSHYWTAVEHAENLIQQKLTRLLAALK